MKTVYELNNNELSGAKIVADDYQLSQNETLIEPDRTQYPPYIFDGTKFNGLTLEQYKQANDLNAKPQATPEQQLLMRQQAQIDSLVKSKEELQKLIAQQQKMITKLSQKLE